VMAQRHGWTLLQGPALRGWPPFPAWAPRWTRPTCPARKRRCCT
jgi:hypothetical protein